MFVPAVSAICKDILQCGSVGTEAVFMRMCGSCICRGAMEQEGKQSI